MDCCNYGEYRGPAQYGAGAWDGYGGYAPLPYAPYAHGYYAPHAHDPYARYYRYDYPSHHMHHDHVMPMDYGGYATKEARVRRSLARREQRAHTPAQHLPLPQTPPLECGMNGRGPAYCEPQMWPHYQMGVMGGGSWNGANAANGGWAPRNACSRDHMRYPPECRPMKAAHLHNQNQACQQDGRSTPYPVYEETPFNGEGRPRQRNTPEFSAGVTQSEGTRGARERFPAEPRRSPPEEKRPPLVPLPAFQQAFGSTEIGKFAEAFSRTEVAVDDTSADNFMFDSFPEWDGSVEPQWSSQPPAPPTSREIKCEDNF
ncbi:uncharacterized protein LOC113494926 isoform X1 [Trichoplusia ni]|uniref:Uncharacterized protein LOC113494926 isoform X1 n=1 Tax=Trichoplusia ni TaxID=7111 RepID=A0A7E5VLT5_TRINI|nr:uncharacterized protein LOC113494926 isoform X1 [Trichoplusia ni]